MEVTIKISDELVARARARGQAPEDYVEEILAESLAVDPSKASARRTPEEIRAWLDQLAQFSDKIPALPDVISREWIYQDHN